MEQWLIDNIALLLGYAGVVVLWVWKGSAFIHKANHAFERLNSMDQRMDKMDQRMDSMDQRMGSIDSNVGRIEGYLHEVGGYMGNNDMNFPRLKEFNLVRAHSPLTLTAQGRELVEASGFAAFVEAHKGIWEDIADAAKTRPDAESYIEKHTIKRINALFDADDMRLADVSDYIYRNGLRESKAIQNELIRAFGVCSRDFTLRLIGRTPPVAPEPDS